MKIGVLVPGQVRLLDRLRARAGLASRKGNELGKIGRNRDLACSSSQTLRSRIWTTAVCCRAARSTLRNYDKSPSDVPPAETDALMQR
ncbi:hypothetical protein HS125_11190 [bacterium]|nr:hypothetical protein [bacterium]